MRLRAAPALPLALGIAAGISLAPALPVLAPAALMLLAGLALALRGPAGRGVGGLAIGLLASVSDRAAAPPDPHRPVVVVGRLVSSWQPRGGGCEASLAVERFRQGLRVERWRRRLLVAAAACPDSAPLGGVRLRGYLGRSPGFANGAPPRPGRWRLRVKHPSFVQDTGGGGGPAAALRRRLERAFDSAGGGPGVALARALVLAQTSSVPTSWRQGMQRAGVSHVLSVSGLHVAMVAAGALMLGRRLPRAARYVVAATAVVQYAAVAGAGAPLVRAAAMATLAAAGTVAGRPPAPVNALAVAGAGLLVHQPLLANDLTFRLTFAATAGILVLAPPLARRWNRLGVLARPLAVSVGAQLAAFPYATPAFSLWPLAAPIVNLAVVPWTAVTLGAALAWLAIAVPAPGAAGVLSGVLDLLARPFGWLDLIPPGSLWCPVASLTPAVAWGVAAALAVLMLGGRRWRLAASAALVAWIAPVSPSGLEATFIDVGQGDAILLRDDERALLVDGGGWSEGDFGGRVLLPALVAAGVRRLDAAVLSHPDRDHCGGLLDITAYLPVAEVWSGPGWRASCATALLARAPRVRVVWAGDRLRWRRWRIRVLHPAAGERGRDNDRSLVLRLEAEGWSVLLTGDIGAAAERRLLARHGEAALASDVLKLAHHGSASSSHAAFLRAVAPRLAVASAGIGNRYGHPAEATLARLRAAGVPVLRTDRDGIVRLRPWRGRPVEIDLPGSPRPG